MAPTSTQEEGGEGSGARGSRPLTRARVRSLQAATTPPRVGLSEPPKSSQRRGTRPGAAKKQSKRSKGIGKSRVAEDAPRASTISLGQEMDVAASAPASAALKQPMEEGSRAGQEPPKKSKMVMADKSHVVEENAPRRSKRKRMGDPEAAAVVSASSGSAAAEQGSPASEQGSPASEQGSPPSYSAVSSPIRRPYLKRDEGKGFFDWLRNIDPAIKVAYDKLKDKYRKKQIRQAKLITLETVPDPYLGNLGYGPTYESGVQTVLKTAKFVFGLSSHIGGKLLNCASGFVIEWNKESKIATVITSSLLICTKPPSLNEWLAKDEFAPHAEVSVHLLNKDDTTAPAKLIHYHKHYDFALFEVKMDLVSEIPSFGTEVKCGQECYVLGRDKYRNLMVNDGTVEHYGANGLYRHHHMFTSCVLNEYYHGGPVIALNGQVLGMITRPARKFMPSVLILNCLRMLKKFDCIPRLHTGMKFSAISFLYTVQRERISRKCNAHVGLIVTEVSEGSIAEKVGIRRGDIIESWNGEVVPTTFELENFLLRLCEDHLDNGDGIGSNVEIPIGVYHVRKDSRCTKTITLKIRDDVEVVARGEYDVSTAISAAGSPDVEVVAPEVVAREYDVSTAISAAVSPDDQNSGHEEPYGSGEDDEDEGEDDED